MTTYGRETDGIVAAGVRCDGGTESGDCPREFERERRLDAPSPEPTTGFRDDPAFAAMHAYSEEVLRLAEQQGWLVNGMGEYCPSCAPNAPQDDDEEEGVEVDFGSAGVRVRPAS